MEGPTVASAEVRASRASAGRRSTESDAGLDVRVPLAATVVAVALVPFLTPGGPAGIAPVDLFIAIAAAAVMVWASVGVKIRAPYAAPVGVLLFAGAAGALAGPVPTAGLLALIQDVWLLAWAIVVANVARSPTGLRLIVHAWVIASVAWATVGLVGVIAGNSFLAGLAANEGGRISLRFGDPNYAANYFVVSIMLIWATSYPRSRVLRMCAYGMLLAAWIFTGSNSGIVSLLVGVTAASILGIPPTLGRGADDCHFELRGAHGLRHRTSCRWGVCNGPPRPVGTKYCGIGSGAAPTASRIAACCSMKALPSTTREDF